MARQQHTKRIPGSLRHLAALLHPETLSGATGSHGIHTGHSRAQIARLLRRTPPKRRDDVRRLFATSGYRKVKPATPGSVLAFLLALPLPVFRTVVESLQRGQVRDDQLAINDVGAVPLTATPPRKRLRGLCRGVAR